MRNASHRLGVAGQGPRLVGRVFAAIALAATALAVAPAAGAAATVSITQPTAGAQLSTPTPTIAGTAGNDAGDSSTVGVSIYSGSSAGGTPVQTLSTTRSSTSWSIAANPLANGTYTAQASQGGAVGSVQSEPLTFSVTTSYRAQVLADSPDGYWRLDESSGTTAADLAGADDNAFYEGGFTLARPGGLPADSDTSVALNGASGQVRTGSTARLGASNGLTVEALINPVSLASTTQTIARKDGQYLLRITPAGVITCRIYKGGAAQEVSTTPGAVHAGAWSHLACSFDGSTMRIYVGGNQLASRALAAPIDTANNRLYLGSSNGYDYFNGRLDEVATYPQALSGARVAAHASLLGGDLTPPTVTLPTPAPDSTMEEAPNFGGSAGTAADDLASVTVRLYSGSSVTGTPAQTLTAPVRSSGTFSVLSPPLASGTYTAQASQSDAAGNVGLSPATTFSVDASADPSLLVAGDIAGCDTQGDEATAAVLDRLPGTVVPAGDLVYEDGSPAQFNDCYDPTWGRHKARTKPVIGGHEYRTPGAAGYFGYWASVAGDPAKGYYSYDLGSWHIVVTNVECDQIGGCGANSPEEQWIRADLATHPAACTAAIIHAPRFSSGTIHGSDDEYEPFWQALYDAGAELVIGGDEHHYERFAPQTPQGERNDAYGMVEIVAGTGGRSHYPFGAIQPNSLVRNNDSFGITQVTLHPGSYDFRFVPEAGKTFTDSGTVPCHGDPPPAVALQHPNPGFATGDARPDFWGEAGTAPGDSSTITVNVYAGTSATGTPVQTLATTRSTGGSWFVNAPSALDQGTYTVQAEQTDNVGNTGRSAGVTFRVDWKPPEPSIAAPAEGSKLATSTPSFTGTAGTATGDGSTVAIKIYSGSSATGTPVQTLTTSATDGNWSVAASQPLTDGTYTAEAEQSDDAGNLGRSSTSTFQVEAEAAPVRLKLREVYAGTSTGAPNARFVELQMWDSGQRDVAGDKLLVYGRTGAILSTDTFPADLPLPSPPNQTSILIATSQAVTFFGVSADLTMATPKIPAAGGQVCYEDVDPTPAFIDCVKWGNFNGASPSPTGTGFGPVGGIPTGKSIELDTSEGDPALLEDGDDDNDSAADYDAVFPAPRNYAGAAGTTSGSAGVVAGKLGFTAGPGVANKLNVESSGGFYVLTDSAAPIVVDTGDTGGCSRVTVNQVRCPQASVSSGALNVALADLNDTVTTVSGLNATVEGQGGRDTLTTRDGDDTLLGGDGDDTLDGGPGADDFGGGAGADTVSYASRAAAEPVVVDIDGAADDGGPIDDDGAGRRDNVMSDVENVTGGAGADSLTGAAVRNALVGGPGVDQLRGLAGNDTIRASGDGANDAVNCGAGSGDHVFADLSDIFASSGPDACEAVN